MMHVDGIDVKIQKGLLPAAGCPFFIQLVACISLLYVSLWLLTQCLFLPLILLSLLGQMKMEGSHLRLIREPQQVQNAHHPRR